LKNRWTSLGVFTAIILGFVLPQMNFLKPLLPYFLGGLLFFNFLRLDLTLQGLKNWKLLWFPLIQWGFLPVLVYFLTVSLDPQIRWGVLLLTLTPVAVASPIIGQIIGADQKLMVFSVVLLNLFSPLAYGLLLPVYTPMENFSFTGGTVFFRILAVVGVPLASALLIQKFFPYIRKIQRWVGYLNPFFLILIVFVAVSSASRYLKVMEPGMILEIFLLVFALSGIWFFTGFFLSRKPRERKALTLIFGHKNTVLAIYMLLVYFSEKAVIPVILYIVAQHLWNGGLIWFLGNQKDEK
jgi:predicted Na+-dependent transporter